MAYEKTNWTSTTPINPTNLNKIENGIAEIANTIYPVGSIYMSVNETNPQDIFGGTWEQIKDTFLLSAGDTYKAGLTGGEAEHTLTVDEMPRHNHPVRSDKTEGGDSAGVKFSWGTAYTSFDKNATDYIGGEQPHNNMPPYLTVYMWKRTS